MNPPKLNFAYLYPTNLLNFLRFPDFIDLSMYVHDTVHDTVTYTIHM